MNIAHFSSKDLIYTFFTQDNRYGIGQIWGLNGVVSRGGRKVDITCTVLVMMILIILTVLYTNLSTWFFGCGYAAGLPLRKNFVTDMFHRSLFLAIIFSVVSALWITADARNKMPQLSTFRQIQRPTGRPARAPQDLPTEFITEAEGETLRYASAGLFNSPYVLIDQAGYRNDLIFSSDGVTVYIPALVPFSGKQGTYLKGTLRHFRSERKCNFVILGQG